MKTVTTWFEPTVMPVHPGVYELEGVPCPFLRWDGEAWYGAGESSADWKDGAIGCRMEFGTSYPSKKRWRGLAEKP